MSYVGVGASVGFGFHIPYLIRTLADSLALAPLEALPLDIDESLWTWMASFSHWHNLKHAVDWWTTRSARRVNGHHLQASTLEVCLEVYRQQCEPEESIQSPSIQSSATDVFNAGLEQARCINCRISNVLLSDSIAKLQVAHSHAGKQKMILEAEAALARHKMAVAYMLAEQVIAKETKSRGQTILEEEQVALPVNTHSQWTFGKNLTEEEILEKWGHTARENVMYSKKKHHSGYYKRQPDGKLDPNRTYSPDPDLQSSFGGTYSDVAPSVTKKIPSDKFRFPEQFNSQQYRWTPPPSGQKIGPEHDDELRSLFGEPSYSKSHLREPNAVISSGTIKNTTASPNYRVGQPSNNDETSDDDTSDENLSDVPNAKDLRNLYTRIAANSACDENIISGADDGDVEDSDDDEDDDYDEDTENLPDPLALQAFTRNTA